MSENMSQINWKRIIVYCFFAFALAWPLSILIYQNGGLFDSPELVPGIQFYVLILIVYMAAPALANVLTRIITKEGFTNLKVSFNLRKGWRFYLISWFAPLVLMAVGAVAFFLIFPQYFDPTLAGLAATMEDMGVDLDELGIPIQLMLALNTLQALLIAPLINAIPVFGEEFGWRAYLQQKLMPLGTRKALVITGVIWGLWHAPIIAMGYNFGGLTNNIYFGSPWSGILMMTLGTIWLGIFIGWLTIRTDSVWPAVFAHASINGLAGLTLYISQGTPPLLLGPTPLGLIGGLGFILLAIVLFRSTKAFLPFGQSD